MCGEGCGGHALLLEAPAQVDLVVVAEPTWPGGRMMPHPVLAGNTPSLPGSPVGVLVQTARGWAARGKET